MVADFGLCKVKEHTFVSTKTTAGSPAWMAPEILRGEHFSHKSDVYGLFLLLLFNHIHIKLQLIDNKSNNK